MLQLTSEAGDTVRLSIDGGALRADLSVGGETTSGSTPLGQGPQVILFATGSVTALMIDENVLFLDHPFAVADLKVGDAAFNVFEIYEGRFGAEAIGRTFELTTLKVFGGPEYAGKHIPIPDFRTRMEELLGDPAPEADAAAPSAAEPAAPVLPVEATPAAVTPAPATKPSPRTMILPSAPKDPEDAPPPSEFKATPIVQAERAFEAEEYDEVLHISSEALARTPSSTRHMWMMAQALEKLGRRMEALNYLQSIFAVRPHDAPGRELEERIRHSEKTPA